MTFIHFIVSFQIFHLFYLLCPSFNLLFILLPIILLPSYFLFFFFIKQFQLPVTSIELPHYYMLAPVSLFHPIWSLLQPVRSFTIEMILTIQCVCRRW